MSYIAARVAYDGTAFHGFQMQRAAPTIQATLEAALHTCTGSMARVVGSGRTDTGVHARGQVVATRVSWKHEIVSLQRAWNANLPGAIAVRDVVAAPDAFHPRFSAERRTYRYTVFDGGEDVMATLQSPRTSPLTDRFALYLPQLL
ncbi:MAG: tRNA pseudouridine synthase A, partial [Caldilineaceae bacterium]|nr:tRNA pseudouridine synthase A [Caldilineaceae bacterium]